MAYTPVDSAPQRGHSTTVLSPEFSATLKVLPADVELEPSGVLECSRVGFGLLRRTMSAPSVRMVSQLTWVAHRAAMKVWYTTMQYTGSEPPGDESLMDM